MNFAPGLNFSVCERFINLPIQPIIAHCPSLTGPSFLADDQIKIGNFQFTVNSVALQI